MNKVITLVGGLLLLAIFAAYMCSFQVRSTEVAVLKTRGKFTQEDVIDEPGLRWKAPWPFQSVVITDKRIRILEDSYEETQTKDSQNIMVTTFVGWKIADPYKFHIASNSEADAESKLRTLIQTEKKNVLARFRLSDLVNTDKEQFRFEEVERELRAKADERAREDYGIEIVELGIRRLSFPKGVTEQIFERMKKSEENKAAKFEAEGMAEAQSIRARASAISENIMAVANRLADEIKAEAQAEVGVYYAEFEKNPELRLFLDRVEATKRMLKERSTLILDDLSPDWLLKMVREPPAGAAPAPPAAGGAATSAEPRATVDDEASAEPQTVVTD